VTRSTIVVTWLTACACAGPARPCTNLAGLLSPGDVIVTGPAETLARAQGLAREWHELEERMIVLEGMLRDPGTLRWPFPVDVGMRDGWLRELVAAAAAEAGVEVHIERIDCFEHPCVAFGEVENRGALEALIATEVVTVARRRATLSMAFTPPEGFRRNAWREVDRAGFGLAFYDEGTASEMLEWRLRGRSEAFWEEEEGAVPSTPDADAGDAAVVAEELLGVRATQKILEMALVESPDPVWPFPDLEGYRPPAMVAAVARAIAETNVSAVVYYADCREYPCLLYGEVGEEWQLERMLAANALESYLSSGYRWLLLRPGDGVERRGGEDCRLHTFTLALYLTADRALMVRRIAVRAQAYWHSRGGVGEDARVWSD